MANSTGLQAAAHIHGQHTIVCTTLSTVLGKQLDCVLFMIILSLPSSCYKYVIVLFAPFAWICQTVLVVEYRLSEGPLIRRSCTH